MIVEWELHCKAGQQCTSGGVTCSCDCLWMCARQLLALSASANVVCRVAHISSVASVTLPEPTTFVPVGCSIALEGMVADAAEFPHGTFVSVSWPTMLLLTAV